MTTFGEAVATRRGSTDPDASLVVLLHGRGSDEQQIAALADHLPQHLAYAAVRAPIAEGSGYAWFANRGIGRPVAESLSETMAWFRTWLEATAPWLWTSVVKVILNQPVFAVLGVLGILLMLLFRPRKPLIGYSRN